MTEPLPSHQGVPPASLPEWTGLLRVTRRAVTLLAYAFRGSALSATQANRIIAPASSYIRTLRRKYDTVVMPDHRARRLKAIIYFAQGSEDYLACMRLPVVFAAVATWVEVSDTWLLKVRECLIITATHQARLRVV
jgi:hypothetical protein